MLENFATTVFVLVNDNNIVCMFDCLFCQVFADSSEPNDDNIQDYRLPSSALK